MTDTKHTGAAIEQIDSQIDANRRTLLARLHCSPGLSSTAWQNAWDRCPDLCSRERELFWQRGLAQQERDALAEKEYRAKRRRLAKSGAAS